MSVEVIADSPLAVQLVALIQPKLAEIGWSTGGDDDSALAEYIILMLVNGKTQEQMASELSGDLLSLGPDDPGANDFSQWLFEQVQHLQQGDSGTAQIPIGGFAQIAPQQDAEMGDVQDGGNSTVPTGPRSMRNGNERGRDKRMMGHLSRNMDRSQDVLHRVKNHAGSERINSHRGPPSGPRGGLNIRGRGGNGLGRGGFPGQAGGPSMTLQQQQELMAMLEQQSAMMASILAPGMGNGFTPPGMNGLGGGFQQQGQGPSLFDRVQPGRNQQNKFRQGPKSNGRPNGQQAAPQAPGSAMDMELTPTHEKPSADARCRFDLSCTNKECMFAHQSPAAPAGTAIDVNDVCPFAAACKNKKCTGRHPSPAQKIAHQTEQDCKFYPNCTNPRCPFKHGPAPCRNGADCTTPNCKFAHSKIVCRFNPCLNPSCVYKHEDGQKRGKFEDKVWVAGGEREHVSERKFVDENDAVEELIVPGNTADQTELAA